MFFDAFSCPSRPQLFGTRGAVSAAHPLATAAGQEILTRRGSAADAAIAAQAVVGVLAPESGGIGGDGFFLIREANGSVAAVNAAGPAPMGLSSSIGNDASSVTVPGLVGGWGALSAGWGRLPLDEVLAPAVRLAADGVRLRPQTLEAARVQRERLARGGAAAWPLLARTYPHAKVIQEALAATLRGIGAEGPRWFYEGPPAQAIEAAVRAHCGALCAADLARHEIAVAAPIAVEWRGWRVHLQPPASQGVPIGMVLRNLTDLSGLAADAIDHVLIELTQAAFAHRNFVSHGGALLEQRLSFDPERAARRGGPRAYLHTAGVATADADGLVVSSLLSVFDDFGSAIYVPEGGFVLNNRGDGFTDPPNEAAPGKLPIHTLAPIVVETQEGCFAMATPGADGHVQTLLQILVQLRQFGLSLADAIERPRWRSETNRLLIEASHPSSAALAERGHDIVVIADGDLRFGGVVCAGLNDSMPFAVSDWRRENWSGVV